MVKFANESIEMICSNNVVKFENSSGSRDVWNNEDNAMSWKNSSMSDCEVFLSMRNRFGRRFGIYWKQEDKLVVYIDICIIESRR